MENKKKIALEGQLQKEKKQKVADEKKEKKTKKTKESKQRAMEAKRKLDTEVLHQTEESERRALGRAMLADASGNKSAFNKSCLNLLNNFQGSKQLVPYY